MYGYQTFKYDELWYWIKDSHKDLKDERVDLWHGPFVIETEAKEDARQFMNNLAQQHEAGAR